MAVRRPKLPVGGGDSIVVWRSAAQMVALYLVLIAIFVVAIVTGYQNQPTTAGRVGAIVFFGVFVALFVFGLVRTLRRRSRLQISTETILYVTPKDDTLTLYRQSGDRLRLVGMGAPGQRRPGLTNGDSQMILPISGYSTRRLRSACTARGWQFPAVISYPASSGTANRNR